MYVDKNDQADRAISIRNNRQISFMNRPSSRGLRQEDGHYDDSMTNKRVVANTSWIVACKMIQSIIQLIVGVLCARYLGPHDYGLIGYANSLVAFAVPLVQLGLYATIVKELVDAPEREGEIMGMSR